ncbi:ParA family protein [Mycolicibacterium aubagnense]|uniref:AAA domain-containing protein n=1 Tax=Mycolicibacterium aubagnense TaxID=319707 RepID=A0ABM7IM41_9MYCO|nr:AAA family ATPase [Mycolicibacterium aubagnense]TLH64237.1 cobalamin biosynthesis protein CobQ [Mycolicibacterium aubagnense]BBX87876.1 hypothetical protein MAUB_57490 [Mycolicibacterium aubagnense]
MTAPHGDAGRQNIRDKYRNAPSDFVDRPPAPPAPAFSDVTYPQQPAAQHQPVPQQPLAPGRPPLVAPSGQPVQTALTDNSVGTGGRHGASAQAADAHNARSARIGVRTEGAQRGWRASVNRMLGLKLSKSADEIEYDQRVAQIQRTLRAPKRIAVVSGKGAAGKTSISLNMGATIASLHRGMKVVALSIDPLGNITDRVRPVNSQAPASVMSLAADDKLERASDVSSYLQTDKTGLRVLGASTCDGAAFLTPEALEKALGVLSDVYDLSILDFGLNIDSPAYHTGLSASDQLILAASTTADSIDELHTLISTLKRFGGKYVELLAGAVVVFCQTRPGKSHIDVDAERTRIVNSYGTPVITIPWDEHISEGGPMSLDLLDENTRLPYVWLAAEVMSRLPSA